MWSVTFMFIFTRSCKIIYFLIDLMLIIGISKCDGYSVEIDPKTVSFRMLWVLFCVRVNWNRAAHRCKFIWVSYLESVLMILFEIYEEISFSFNSFTVLSFIIILNLVVLFYDSKKVVSTLDADILTKDSWYLLIRAGNRQASKSSVMNLTSNEQGIHHLNISTPLLICT